jgi:hypothetical protein
VSGSREVKFAQIWHWSKFVGKLHGGIKAREMFLAVSAKLPAFLMDSSAVRMNYLP